MDHGPGLLEPFLSQILRSFRGWGRRARALVRGSRTLVDGLMEVGVGDNVCLEMAKKWKVAHEKNCQRFAN